MIPVQGTRRKLSSNAPFGVRVCQWCGEDFGARKEAQAFCCEAHNTEFNNLQKERGAIVYGLMMEWRYNRGPSATIKLFGKICTILANFRREDHEKRAGRKSWRPPSHALERRPDLLGKPLNWRRKP
jgi:hypothetical protein